MLMYHRNNNSRDKESAFREIREFLDKLSLFRREENIQYSATILGISAKLFGSQTKIENSSIKELLTLLEPRDFGEY